MSPVVLLWFTDGDAPTGLNFMIGQILISPFKECLHLQFPRLLPRRLSKEGPHVLSHEANLVNQNQVVEIRYIKVWITFLQLHIDLRYCPASLYFFVKAWIYWTSVLPVLLLPFRNVVGPS